MELEIVEVGEDRYQIVDQRGRLVHATGSKEEAGGILIGYKLGREDATRIVRGALEPIPERIALSRG